MVACVFLSRVLGLLRDTVLAYRFGIGLDADSFRIAAVLPDFIFLLIAAGGLSSAFIPVFSDFLHTDREKDAWSVFSVVVTYVAVLSTVLITVVWLAAPQIVTFFASGKDPRVIGPAIAMSRIMLPAQFAFMVGSVLLATLYSRKRFAVPGLAPNVYNVFIISAAIFLPMTLGTGIESMAWGALSGAIVGNLILPIIAMSRIGSHFSPSLDYRAPGVDKFFKLLLPVVLGFSLPSMITMITQKFASEYGRDGLNAVMTNSSNLMQAPLGIFGQSLAIAIFPILAEMVAIKRMDRYRQEISRTMRTVLYLGFPSGALMMALAPQIAHAIYGYGRAMQSPENLQAISDCVRIYSIGVFAWCVQPVLMRGFFSIHKTLKPVAIGSVMTIVFVLLCVAATHFSSDFRLLPVATDISVIVLAILLFFALEQDVGRLDRPRIMATLLLSMGAAAITGCVCFGITQLIHPRHRLAEIGLLLFVALIGAWVYYFITRWMRMPETDYVDRVVKRISWLRRP
jgi:putative peptidoglycan lipid II flippase